MSTIEKALGSLNQPQPASGDGEGAPAVAGAAADKVAAPAAQPQTPTPAPTPASGQSRPLPSAPRPSVNIPFDVLHAKGFLTPATPRSVIAEEFRTIKRPLLRNILGQSVTPIPQANLIMVTSALQGDGKTFCSLNLAISIAMEQDKTVLFIDADMLKASAGTLLGIPSGTPGLIDILNDDRIKPQDVILRTNMDKLRILPAGRPHEHATELLASENMQQLMLELSARYSDRVIVFDSPPLLLTTESAVLASFMGQILFVAAANVTPQHAIKEALERISEEKMVGMMLNMLPRRRFNLFGMGYGYGYGYGYGHGHRESGPAETTDVRSH
ncbi:MAG: XrtA-associated tyrosine autokinase [Porticoccaceae bacterium]